MDHSYIQLYQTHSSSTLDRQDLHHLFIYSRSLLSNFSGRGPTVAMQAPVADIASVRTSMLLELQGNDHDAVLHEPIGNDSLSGRMPFRGQWLQNRFC